MFTLELSLILRRSPQQIKLTFFPLDPCWLPVKLILKQENKIFVGIYLKLWVGRPGRASVRLIPRIILKISYHASQSPRHVSQCREGHQDTALASHWSLA